MKGKAEMPKAIKIEVTIDETRFDRLLELFKRRVALLKELAAINAEIETIEYPIVEFKAEESES